MYCPECGQMMTGVQYGYDEAEHYDGISEWRCEGCHIRIGRWTGRHLKGDELEPSYLRQRACGRCGATQGLRTCICRVHTRRYSRLCFDCTKELHPEEKWTEA